MSETRTQYTNNHVVISSQKPFAQTVKDLQAELGKASTEVLMTKLSSSKSFEEFSEEIESLTGRSNLIEVGFLNWGKVMSRAQIGMKAQLFVIGNPLTAKKLLEAGGPEVGLYLPTKIFIFEDAGGQTQVSYDEIAPALAHLENPKVDAVTQMIDKVLAKLAHSAAN